MDDDDIYSEEAVEKYLNIWNEIGNNPEIGAIRTLAKHQNGKYVVSGCNIEDKIGTYEDCTTLEMNYIKHCHQENWTCYRTDALRNIDLFPHDYWLSESHTFFSEAIWQGRFARKYKCRYYYTCLRTYTSDAPESIIRSSKSKQHYLNMFINSKILLDEQYDYISKSSKQLVTNVLLVQFLRYHLKIKQRELIKNTKSTKIKLLYWIAYPISIFGNKVIKRRNSK